MTLSELQKCRPSASNPWWNANFGGTCDHRREGTPQIRTETQANEASKVFLEYKSVVHI